jgi:Arc/MetJ-type ribon-helix-helix transcriptional regulator
MARDNDLTSMTVSLPATQKDYVKEQATASGCSTPSEYIRRLIHADQKAREQENLERMILEGLDSCRRRSRSA